MKTNFVCPLIVGLFAFTAGFLVIQNVSAQVAADSNSLITFAHQAISDDPTESAAAIKTLRAAGPLGMQALSAVYSNEIAGHLQRNYAGQHAIVGETWDRIRLAFDSVGEQHDNYVSQLYWFTDLEQAEVAARASGKPILSLRLLGKLDEEYSCANSRFFRTTLYANSEVAKYLRENFILHWQSVRPVPVITIDFGDGRKIVRTITGNSIHYILDGEGSPIDALPGLYGAKAFLAGLQRAAVAEQQASKLNGDGREAFLKNYHATQLAEIQRQFSHDLAQAGLTNQNHLQALSDSNWQAIAALHAGDARLDKSALDLIRIKQPDVAKAMWLTMTKAIVETPMMRMVRNLKHSIAEDTVLNEYEMHARIHEWFADGLAPQNLDELNKKIYADLFLTPDSDPWLGLAPADIFSALDHGGVAQATTH